MIYVKKSSGVQNMGKTKLESSNRLLNFFGNHGGRYLFHLERNGRIRMLVSATWFTIRYIEPVMLYIVGVWAVICWALTLPNPMRALTIYSLLAGLCIAAQSINPKRRC